MAQEVAEALGLSVAADPRAASRMMALRLRQISERASVTEYFTNEHDIQEEILRRWTVLKSAKPVAKKAPEPNANVKVLPMLLDEAHLTALDYIYIGPTKSGDHMYGIKKAASPAASQSEGKKKSKEAKPAVKLETMPAATKSETGKPMQAWH